MFEPDSHSQLSSLCTSRRFSRSLLWLQICITMIVRMWWDVMWVSENRPRQSQQPLSICLVSLCCQVIKHTNNSCEIQILEDYVAQFLFFTAIARTYEPGWKLKAAVDSNKVQFCQTLTRLSGTCTLCTRWNFSTPLQSREKYFLLHYTYLTDTVPTYITNQDFIFTYIQNKFKD